MQRILKWIAERPKGKPFVVAIDGRSGAGKSTLAARLAAECGAALLHVDDFYLPLAVRTEEMMQQPAGHIDTELLLNEVLLPLMRGRPAVYRRFDCRSLCGTHLFKRCVRLGLRANSASHLRSADNSARFYPCRYPGAYHWLLYFKHRLNSQHS